MGSSQIPFVFHVTVALVLSPFWSNKTNGVVLEVPLASFQFDWATTPATSVLPIAVPSPTNLIPIAAAFATVRVTLAVWVKLPLVPLIVSVDVPSGVVPLVTVSVELPEPVTVAGEKLAVAPPGSPLALSVTAPLKPSTAPMLVVKVVAFPTTTVCELGVAVRLKVGVVGARGTIWMALTGARGSESVDAPGVAVIVNPVAVMVNST